MIGALIMHRSTASSSIRPRPSASSSGTRAPGTSAAPGSTSAGATSAPAALVVSAISPATGTTNVPGSEPISVSFSTPLAQDTPTPTLSPATPGSWEVSGDVLRFAPSTDFTPLSTVTLTIPGGTNGVVAADGAHLAQAVSEQFRIEDGSILRLQQLLSILDYSPLAWTPASGAIAPSDTAAQAGALFTPPAGAFAWRNGGWPAQLRALWEPGRYDVLTKGLVMSFEADHGLNPNGHLGPALWHALTVALAQHTVNTGGYNYALANKTAPETLTVYHDGRVVLQTTANTGIAQSPTPDGTFPVFTRLRSQVMRGTNPDGQHYADLVQYVAYFHGNDAVHYMDRADYGIPQSLGCIELPLTAAARAWPYLAYGTLVTVVN